MFGEDMDLTKISAADFLAALEQAETAETETTEEVEKTASQVVSELTDEDLEKISAEDLMELLAAVEQEEAVAEKTAALQGGDYDGYALAGEVMGTAMAEAFAANMNKMAADEAPEEEVDLSQISAAELLNAIAEMEQEEGQSPLA